MTQIKSCEILCVGTELLLGQIVNTNAAWLAREISLLGIYSYYQTVVGDNPDRVINALAISAGRSDLVILTGGLGPTQDDLTMACAAQFAGRRLVLHEPSKNAIRDYFHSLGRTQVTDNNWKQAMMPEGAKVLPNHNGTAPGAIIEMDKPEEHRTIRLVLLPGPPSEMQLMFQESVRPYLQKMTGTCLRHRFIRLIGIGESAAETALLDLIETQSNPTLAPYAQEGEVMFRMTQSCRSEEDPDLIEPLLSEVKSRLGQYIYEIGTRTMPEVLRDLLLEQQKTISLAESCTGGMVSSAITDYAGASNIFLGAVIAYDNRVKASFLKVSPETMAHHGAVSEECAREMAEGCRNVMSTSLAVAITGIAGPDGGTPEKPVGLVWLAVSGEKGTRTRRLQLGGNRARIRKVATLNALDLARRYLLE
jgi:nicotinamide-nucleotide amidase